jgi:hypothetical protein
MRQQGIYGLPGVRAGTCHAWPLPADATCATVARQVFRDSVSEVGLEPDLLDDCVLMASELAANTLHARAAAGTGGGGDRLVSVAPDMGGEPMSSAGPVPRSSQDHSQGQHSRDQHSRDQHSQDQQLPPAAPGSGSWTAAGSPELWLYLRGLGSRRELVCKVFDGHRGWRHGLAPTAARIAPQGLQSVTGRGLQIVQELSGGRWGFHPTRARLGGWGARGKAVWFAVPAPLAHARLVDVTGLRAYTLSADVSATRAHERLSARQAARELETMLGERGVGGQLVRADQPGSDMSVLSVCHGLTVWCRSGVVSLSTPEGARERWNYADLVEAAEQTVRRYEELELGEDLLAAEA